MLSSASTTSSSNRSGATSIMGGTLSTGLYRVAVDPARLLDGLDADQVASVTSPGGPLAILAPAGSGKTRVLTRRIAYRVAEGSADAAHTLAITFTRKAAGELLRRLDE